MIIGDGVLQGDRGCPPLYYALRQSNLPMVQMLLEFGARIDITMKGDAEVSGGGGWVEVGVQVCVC